MHHQVTKMINDNSLAVLAPVIDEHGNAINFLMNLFEPANVQELINSDVQDYDIRDQWAIRVVADTTRHIGGFMRGDAGRMLFVINPGPQTVVLDHENTLSQPVNRILNVTGIGRTLASGAVSLLLYDEPSGRWRVVI